MKPDGTPYYKYILCYVDDVLIISMDPDGITNKFNEHFVLKELLYPAKKWQCYLGATIGKYNFLGSYGWYVSAKEYLSHAIPAVEATWDNKLYQKASSPLMGNYHPELDISPLLSDNNVLLFARYIDILQWAVELGWIDLTQLVILMSQFWNAPCEGHMAAVFCISLGMSRATSIQNLFSIQPTRCGATLTDMKMMSGRRNTQMPLSLSHHKARMHRSTSTAMLLMQHVWQCINWQWGSLCFWMVQLWSGTPNNKTQ